MYYVIKVEIPDMQVETFRFISQKTMYGGKQIREGDTVFLFASENEGGNGLFARGIVITSVAIPKKLGVSRQTPCVDVTIKRTSLANRPLGRRELKPYKSWSDGLPPSELNFKLYRQATDKIIGISDTTAEFLEKFF
jgi:hypothetical protein